MARPAQNFHLGVFLERERLKSTGANFNDWHRSLRILLLAHKKSYVIETELPTTPLAATASDEDKTAHEQWIDDNIIVRCGMLQAMEAGLQKRFENFTAFKKKFDS